MERCVRLDKVIPILILRLLPSGDLKVLMASSMALAISSTRSRGVPILTFSSSSSCPAMRCSSVRRPAYSAESVYQVVVPMNREISVPDDRRPSPHRHYALQCTVYQSEGLPTIQTVPTEVYRLGIVCLLTFSQQACLQYCRFCVPSCSG